MLQPHPAILRKLVEEYEEYEEYEAYEALAQDESREPASRPGGRRAQDLAYTLCVTMGTRDVRTALEAARRQLRAVHDPMTVSVVPRPRTVTGPASATTGAPAGA
ncbi:DUF5133 domain-containing protein [Streptomyces phyllanthi]|uniref:DUF5133 domain-containing protein n=1 Tax=Streptomyces phyllanthi TaxID=1803180 RepID=A0A5N8W317_9ACTN|nr:DUF5133 domain-containing protein [Streptomyces phyllanthi]MPY41296.1 DUF5133 domain-containing protein [Streptomyces phyllanthi]